MQIFALPILDIFLQVHSKYKSNYTLITTELTLIFHVHAGPRVFFRSGRLHKFQFIYNMNLCLKKYRNLILLVVVLFRNGLMELLTHLHTHPPNHGMAE